jgi:hypothetical protein
MRAPELRPKAWCGCPVPAGRRCRVESRETGALFFEFATMPTLETDGKEGDKTETDEEDSEHEDPAPMSVDPRPH